MDFKDKAKRFVRTHLPTLNIWRPTAKITAETLTNLKGNLRKLLESQWKQAHQQGYKLGIRIVCERTGNYDLIEQDGELEVLGHPLSNYFDLLAFCDEQDIKLTELHDRAISNAQRVREQEHEINELHEALEAAKAQPTIQVNEAPRAQIIDSHVGEVHVHEDDEVEVIVTKGPGRFTRRVFRGVKPRDPNDDLRRYRG